MRIAVLQWATPDYQLEFAPFLARNRAYAASHNYSYILDGAPHHEAAPDLPPHWGKVAALSALLDARVPCCLAAGDPALLGARTAHGLLREFGAARHALGLGDDALAELARASVRASCAPAELKSRLIADIDMWLALD